MLLAIHRPQPPLNRFVEEVIYHSGYSVPHTRERMLPDGNMYIIIDLSETPKHVYADDDTGRKTSFKRGWVSGAKTEPIIFDAANRSTMLVIRFVPGGAVPLFNFPMQTLFNQVIELDAIWGNRFTALREKLLNCKSPQAMFDTIDAFIFGMAADRLALHPCVDYATASLQAAPYDTAIAQLRQKAGYSHKHFIRLFEQNIGLTPKKFSRLVRFQQILVLLESAGKPESWAQFALEAGYYDQAHFIKEFKAFSGLSPTQYMRQKGEFLGYLPCD